VNPAVTVDIAAASLSGSGRIVEAGTDEDRSARDLVLAKYTPTYGGDLIGRRDTALPIAIDLKAAAEQQVPHCPTSPLEVVVRNGVADRHRRRD